MSQPNPGLRSPASFRPTQVQVRAALPLSDEPRVVCRRFVIVRQTTLAPVRPTQGCLSPLRDRKADYPSDPSRASRSLPAAFPGLFSARSLLTRVRFWRSLVRPEPIFSPTGVHGLPYFPRERPLAGSLWILLYSVLMVLVPQGFHPQSAIPPAERRMLQTIMMNNSPITPAAARERCGGSSIWQQRIFMCSELSSFLSLLELPRRIAL